MQNVAFLKVSGMIVAIILTCLAMTASTVPVTPSMALLQPTERGDQPVQRDTLLNVTPGTQVLVQIQPNVQQPQPGVPQQQGVGEPQFLVPMQQQPWAPQGIPLFMPFQPSIQGSTPANNQPSQPQQQLMFPPYGYFPVLPSPQGNQLPFPPQAFPPQFPPYGFPMIFQAPPPQFPANPAPAGPVAPAQPPAAPAAGPVAGPVAGPAAPELKEQPQNPHILYMFQQPMNAQLGLSSEELEMAARMTQQVGMFVPAEAAKPASGNQPAGPVSLNPGVPMFLPSPGLIPTMGILQGGVPQAEGVTAPGAPLEARKACPVGLENPRQDTATVPAPAPFQSNQQTNDPGTVDTNTPPQIDFFLEVAPKQNVFP